MFGMLNQNVHRTFWLKVPKGQRTNCERKAHRSHPALTMAAAGPATPPQMTKWMMWASCQSPSQCSWSPNRSHGEFRARWGVKDTPRWMILQIVGTPLRMLAPMDPEILNSRRDNMASLPASQSSPRGACFRQSGQPAKCHHCLEDNRSWGYRPEQPPRWAPPWRPLWTGEALRRPT